VVFNAVILKIQLVGVMEGDTSCTTISLSK
jgi:hypothetical protein